jgi:hypothetical protein
MASALFSCSWGSATAGLIVNGDFEQGNFSGWSVSTPDAFVLHSFDGFNPNGGAFFALLETPFHLGAISQTISDTAGRDYVLSVHLGSDGRTPNEFKIDWNGKPLYDQTNLPDTRSNPSQYNLLSFSVVGTGSDTLTLSGQNNVGELAVDDVSLNAAPDAAAPEPSTFVISSILLATLGIARSYNRLKVKPGKLTS